ncbi:response regulator transcription factor [Blautia sp. Marseille-P3201T]|uniref:response regulator transcription factor n=1 Tax=Blautia sp. Marseille-P3201T TaxID=1907659 RepID=UPI000930EF51|nr:response regulator transcription factor [Blautia sp. Marseille-P3201T]
MVNILIVEDEKPISDLIKLSLKGAGYFCSCAYDGETAADMIEENRYDLILLDIMIPYIDGFELLEYIKPFDIPVIFITAMNSTKDRVKGLKMGAEDYIVKPFEVVELLARVEVVLRRFHKTSDIIWIGDKLTINLKQHVVRYEEQEIALTPKEYDLLVLFAQNPNVALYRETIYERVWGGNLECTGKTVDLHVQRLRKKAHIENMIKAVNKVGYRLEMKT